MQEIYYCGKDGGNERYGIELVLILCVHGNSLFVYLVLLVIIEEVCKFCFQKICLLNFWRKQPQMQCCKWK